MKTHSTSRFGLPPRSRPSHTENEALAASAARADLIIAVFALGVLFGWLLGKVGAI